MFCLLRNKASSEDNFRIEGKFLVTDVSQYFYLTRRFACLVSPITNKAVKRTLDDFPKLLKTIFKEDDYTKGFSSDNENNLDS